MEKTDTIKLLQECDAGSKMAVSSIDDVIDNVSDKTMLNLLKESREHHEKLGNELHQKLNEKGTAEKEPSPIAKGMSKVKTNVKMGMDGSDQTIARLIVDGCDMGIKSLYQYLNQYKEAEEPAKEICNKLIGIEEKLRKELYKFL